MLLWLGLATLAAWAILLVPQALFVLRARRVAGRVVEIKLGGEDGDVPGPVVEYMHPDGDVRRHDAKWFSTRYAKTQVGDALEVLVAGSRVRIAAFAELWFFRVAMGVFITITLATVYVLRDS
jgi:hypothetical protein